MLSVVKGAWKLIVAIKDALVLLLLLLFFALIYAGIKLARSEPGGIPGKGALYLTLDGPIVEQPREIDQVRGADRQCRPGRISPARCRACDRGRPADDSAIKAVVLDLDGFGGGGQVAMQRVGAALDKVRKAGKPVLTHATYYDDDGYLLAAHASEVWLSPARHGRRLPGRVGATSIIRASSTSLAPRSTSIASAPTRAPSSPISAPISRPKPSPRTKR